MFELPDAKRVRREDLYDSPSDRPSSPGPEDEATEADLRAKLNARLSSLLVLDIPPLPTPAAAVATAAQTEPEPTTAATTATIKATDDPQPPSDSDSDSDSGATTNKAKEAEKQAAAAAEEEEFTFRLFSTSSASQKVILPPTDTTSTITLFPTEGPFPISERPLSHYLRGELTPREHAQFQYAAVTGREVRAAAKRERAWGLEVPWRVVSVKVVGRLKGGMGRGVWGVENGVGVEGKKKKKRLGKKSRVVARKREKARREEAAKVEERMASKEELLREKKKRLNRERKMKRRLKEKEKKAAGKGDGEGVQEGEGSVAGTDS